MACSLSRRIDVGFVASRLFFYVLQLSTSGLKF